MIVTTADNPRLAFTQITEQRRRELEAKSAALAVEEHIADKALAAAKEDKKEAHKRAAPVAEALETGLESTKVPTVKQVDLSAKKISIVRTDPERQWDPASIDSFGVLEVREATDEELAAAKQASLPGIDSDLARSRAIAPALGEAIDRELGEKGSGSSAEPPTSLAGASLEISVPGSGLPPVALSEQQLVDLGKHSRGMLPVGPAKRRGKGRAG